MTMPGELKGKELVAMVSYITGLDAGLVYRIIHVYFEEMGKALDKRERVTIMGLGTFWVKETSDALPILKFSPSLDMKNRVNVRPEMNKYGVVLDKNKTMAAKLTGKCPMCKTDLETIDPPKCPICGTQPFEDRAQHEDGNG